MSCCSRDRSIDRSGRSTTACCLHLHPYICIDRGIFWSIQRMGFVSWILDGRTDGLTDVGPERQSFVLLLLLLYFGPDQEHHRWARERERPWWSMATWLTSSNFFSLWGDTANPCQYSVIPLLLLSASSDELLFFFFFSLFVRSRDPLCCLLGSKESWVGKWSMRVGGHTYQVVIIFWTLCTAPLLLCCVCTEMVHMNQQRFG